MRSRPSKTPEQLEAHRQYQRQWARDHAAQHKAYRDAHKEEKRANGARYYEANREAILAQCKEYRAAHREEKNTKDREWWAANREAIRLRRNAAYQANREKMKEQRQRSYQKHKEARQAANQRWAQEHPEQQRQIKRRWKKANPDQARMDSQRRRANEAAAPVNDLTRAQWEFIKTHYGHRCVYCRRKMKRLTMDHLTPISKGGNHTASNIVPACQSCNATKGTKTVLIPVQPLLLIPA